MTSGLLLTPFPYNGGQHSKHTHLFNGQGLPGWTGRAYQKGQTNLDFTEVRDSEWQWHQLGRMQVCTSLQTDNHASTPPLSFYRPDALPAAQQTASKHSKQTTNEITDQIPPAHERKHNFKNSVYFSRTKTAWTYYTCANKYAKNKERN